MTDALKEFFNSHTITLKPLEWRAFVGHARSDNLNPTLLEIRCEWARSLLMDDINVGTPSEKLDEIPIMMMPLPVGGDYFKKWNTHAADDGKPKNGEQKTPHAGELTYHAPIRTADGVVNDKTGSVTGWFIVGEENYKDIWRRLAMVPSPEFLIGLTILFENEERMWDGATPLAITEGKLVFTGTPAQNANEAERRNDMARVTVVGFDELLTDVRDIAKRLDNRVGLVLGALILILTAIWLRH